jgi:hypothetical protein
MLEIVLYSLLIAITSCVYVFILTDTGMILGWWCDLLHKYIKSDWILKPIIDCEYCISGQIALWSYLFIYKSIFEWFVFIILSIFFTRIINRLWN